MEKVIVKAFMKNEVLVPVVEFNGRIVLDITDCILDTSAGSISCEYILDGTKVRPMWRSNLEKEGWVEVSKEDLEARNGWGYIGEHIGDHCAPEFVRFIEVVLAWYRYPHEHCINFVVPIRGHYKYSTTRHPRTIRG